MSENLVSYSCKFNVTVQHLHININHKAIEKTNKFESYSNCRYKFFIPCVLADERIKLNIFKLFLSIHFSQFQGHKLYCC